MCSLVKNLAANPGFLACFFGILGSIVGYIAASGILKDYIYYKYGKKTKEKVITKEAKDNKKKEKG